MGRLPSLYLFVHLKEVWYKGCQNQLEALHLAHEKFECLTILFHSHLTVVSTGEDVRVFFHESPYRQVFQLCM